MDVKKHSYVFYKSLKTCFMVFLLMFLFFKLFYFKKCFWCFLMSCFLLLLKHKYRITNMIYFLWANCVQLFLICTFSTFRILVFTNGSFFVFNYCLSNAVHSIEQSIKSHECPCVRACICASNFS